MAVITDPEVVRFNNESVRPVSEALRALKDRLESVKSRYDQQIASHLGTLSDTIDDGRAAEGVAELSANDVVLFMGRVDAVLEALSAEGADNVIEKPCVRPVNSGVSI